MSKRNLLNELSENTSLAEYSHADPLGINGLPAIEREVAFKYHNHVERKILLQIIDDVVGHDGRLIYQTDNDNIRFMASPEEHIKVYLRCLKNRIVSEELLVLINAYNHLSAENKGDFMDHKRDEDNKAKSKAVFQGGVVTRPTCSAV